MEIYQKNRTPLRDIFYICFKHKIQIIFFFLATICIVAAGTIVAEPVYEAQAQVLVKVGRENVYVPVSGNVNPFFRVDNEEKLNSAIEILKSPSLVEKTVLILGPTVIYEKLKNVESNRSLYQIKNKETGNNDLVSTAQEMKKLSNVNASILKQAMLEFTEDLRIVGIKDSNIININFRHKDPRIAANAVNQLTNSYMDHYLKVYKMGESNDFYQRQVDFLKNKLLKNEDKLNDLKISFNITSLEEQQLLLLNKAANQRSDLNKTLSLETETRNRIHELSKQLTKIPDTIPQEAEAADNPYLISSLEARLVELQLEEKKLLTKYTDENRLIKNIRAEIQIVQKKLSDQEEKKYEKSRSGVNATYQKLLSELLHNQAELRALKAKASTQKSQLEEYQEELKNLGHIESQYKGLLQDIELDRQNYLNYLNRLEDSRISEAMDAEKIASVSLIEPAKPPLEPISPKKKLNLAIGIILGILGGLGLAFFREYLSDSFDRPEDIENFLETKVLTSIPMIKNNNEPI